MNVANAALMMIRVDLKRVINNVVHMVVEG